MSDPQSIAAMITAALSVIGGAFAIFKYLDGKISAAKRAGVIAASEFKAAIDKELTGLEAKIEQLRAECAKRDDIREIRDALAAMTGRIDSIHTLLARRGEAA